MGTPVYQPTSRTSLAKMPKEYLEILTFAHAQIVRKYLKKD